MRKNVLGYLLSIIVLSFFISSTNNHLYGKMLRNTNIVSTSFNNKSLVEKSNTKIKRDLLHDQNAWIHEYSHKNDIVTWIKLNPDSLRYSKTPTIYETPIYSIFSDPSGLFSLDGNLLLLNDVSELKTSAIYKVTVLCEVQNMWDTAQITIHSIDSDIIKYVDLNNPINGDGSWANPYNKPITQMSPNTYYFYKRGTSYGILGETIEFAENSAMIAYGQGTRPRLRVRNDDNDDFIVSFSWGDNNSIIHGFEFDCIDNPSRCINIYPPSNIEVSFCRIDSAYVGIWTDVDNYSEGKDDCNNIRIYDNSIYQSGEDPIRVEVAFSEIVGNIIHTIGRTAPFGDGIHVTRSHSVYVGHNWIFMGPNYTEKQILLLSNGIIGESDDHPYGDDLGGSIVEHNTCYGNEFVRGGITAIGKNATIRYNYVNGNSKYAYSQGISGFYSENVTFHHNISKNWIEGGEYRHEGNLFLNNIFENVEIGIKGNDSNGGVIIKNNIFKDVSNKFLDIVSTNKSIYLDNNLYDLSNSNWKIDGKFYSDFKNIKDNQYEINGLYENADFDKDTYIPSSEGNLIDAGEDSNLSYDFIGTPLKNKPEIGILERNEDIEWISTTNSAPVIQEQTFNMADTLTQGLTFARIIASDTDEGQSIYYKIVSGNSANTFSVDSVTGNIIYNGNSRINEIGNFRIGVAVIDNGQPPLTSETDIRIEIEHILIENEDGNKSGETTDNTETTKMAWFYIDPENVSDSNEDGSKEHPFDSWTDITWTDNSTYLQKNGTTTYIEKLLITANNVTIGSYGDNEKQPVIVSNTKEYAIKAYDKKNITISGLNIIAEEAVGSVYFLGSEADSIIVEKCTFSNSVFGIRIMEGKNFTVRYNTFKNNYTAVHSTAEITSIYYNIFQSNDMSINLMSYLSTSEVYNNTFYDNSIAISTSYGSLSMYNNIFYMAKDNDVALQSTQSKLFSDYNLFYPENDGFINIEDTLFNTLESFQAAKKLDLSSLNSDPLFVDMYNDNFMVSSKSPAIEKGKLFGELTDFFGSPVPLGDFPDIGAHEVNLKSGEMTGITNENSENSISIYPNPSKGIVNIETTKEIFTEGYTLSVFNSEGRIVYSEISLNSKNSYNLSFLPKGLYLINVRNKSHSFTKKLLIE